MFNNNLNWKKNKIEDLSSKLGSRTSVLPLGLGFKTKPFNIINTIKMGLKSPLLVLFSFLILSGCGSDSGTPLTTSTISGTAVDGYIYGATVCIDTNSNNICDENEASTTTSIDGTFTFTTTLNSGDYPIIIYGGKDMATNEDFNGTLKNIVSLEENNTSLTTTITPISTLVANLVQNDTNTTIEQAKQTIATNLDINISQIDANPLENKNIFIKSQQIMQTVNILTKSINNTKDKDLFDHIMTQVAISIKDNTTQDINVSDIVTKLENTTYNNENITISNDIEDFTQKFINDIDTKTLSMPNDTDLNDIQNDFTTFIDDINIQNSTNLNNIITDFIDVNLSSSNITPIFVNDTNITISENQPNDITLNATDIDGGNLTYSISGTDASSFNIDSSTGVVTFINEPNFERGTILYHFTATVSDGTNEKTQNISIDIDGTIQGQLIDSAIQGVTYTTNSINGVTDENGYFKYKQSDTSITFNIGNLKLADFNISSINSDNRILPADIVKVDRNNTTNTNLKLIIRTLQSLDNDNNATNGILIDDNTKNGISQALDNNSSYNINLTDNNISTLQSLMRTIGKTFRVEKDAREHYKSTLTSLGYTPEFAPFITVWETNSTDTNITIPTYSAYDYNYTVSWGDGDINSSVDGNITHTYSTDGNHTISITGTFPTIQFNNTGSKLLINNISSWGDISWKDFSFSFYGCTNLESNATDTPDLSDVNSTAYMFAYAKKFNSDINSWNVSNITDMHTMFDYAINFNQPLNNWDISNVTNMFGIFYNATSFNQPLNDWNTSSVTNMNDMFEFSQNFNQPLNNWDVSNVIYMNHMFDYAESFSNQDLSDWNVSNVTGYDYFMTNSGSGNTEPNWP